MIISDITTSKIKADWLSPKEKLILEQKCKPFLEAIDYDVDAHKVFRGSKPRNPDTQILGTNLFVGTGFIKDRSPKAIPISIHKRLNEFFVKKFGTPFRDSVFATGDYDQSTDYGSVYHFFPVGNFKYCWAPYQRDLFHYIDERDGKFTDEQLKELVDTYRTTDLKEAIYEEVEIMFYCESSILVPVQE
jgi:hypothetical protein